MQIFFDYLLKCVNLKETVLFKYCLCVNFHFELMLFITAVPFAGSSFARFYFSGAFFLILFLFVCIWVLVEREIHHG